MDRSSPRSLREAVRAERRGRGERAGDRHAPERRAARARPQSWLHPIAIDRKTATWTRLSPQKSSSAPDRDSRNLRRASSPSQPSRIECVRKSSAPDQLDDAGRPTGSTERRAARSPRSATVIALGVIPVATSRRVRARETRRSTCLDMKPSLALIRLRRSHVSARATSPRPGQREASVSDRPAMEPRRSVARSAVEQLAGAPRARRRRQHQSGRAVSTITAWRIHVERRQARPASRAAPGASRAAARRWRAGGRTGAANAGTASAVEAHRPRIPGQAPSTSRPWTTMRPNPARVAASAIRLTSGMPATGVVPRRRRRRPRRPAGSAAEPRQAASASTAARFRSDGSRRLDSQSDAAIDSGSSSPSRRWDSRASASTSTQSEASARLAPSVASPVASATNWSATAWNQSGCCEPSESPDANDQRCSPLRSVRSTACRPGSRWRRPCR